MLRLTHCTMLEGNLYFVDRKGGLHQARFPKSPLKNLL